MGGGCAVPKNGRPAMRAVEATVPAALMVTARSRDGAAVASYEAVFQGHYARLVGTLAVACGDRDLAADVVQQAFVQLWVNWKKVPPWAVSVYLGASGRTSHVQTAIARLTATMISAQKKER